MPIADRDRRAKSFSQFADLYQRARPSYPPEAIGWLLGPEPLEVLDLGAGTGKLTAALLAAGHRVTALEPLEEMRALLAANLTAATAIGGRAEELPLPDRSFDALVAGSAFWLLDQTGVKMLSGVFALFFSGMALPLVIFPEPLRSIALALPWASYLQTPADIWLGKDQGGDLLAALGLQVVWVVVLLAACQAMLLAATRKVVVQGG